MLKIFQADIERDRGKIEGIFSDYLHYVKPRISKEYGFDFDPDEVAQRDMAELGKFMPPKGRLLLAEDGGQCVGCVCLKEMRPGIGELKRMYVHPHARGRGIGRSLLDAVLTEARNIGYSTIRLDTARFMLEAQSLYGSVGFQKIEPYAESEVPEEYHRYWVFMELPLGAS